VGRGSQDRGKDDHQRRRYARGDKLPRRDRIWPQLHGKFWNYDDEQARTKTVEELFAELRHGDVEEARETLEHVEAIAQSAVDRAAAADRRASTIAGTVAIAASFTLSGSALILDNSKLADKTVRLSFAIVLFVTTSLFVLSALYSLRALVATRAWNWSEPFDLPRNPGDSRETQLGWRAAHLLEDFGANWEISLVKDRTVDLALLCLVAALVGIAVVAGILVWYVATVNPPPISSP
jgi:hypothetical protein